MTTEIIYGWIVTVCLIYPICKFIMWQIKEGQNVKLQYETSYCPNDTFYVNPGEEELTEEETQAISALSQIKGNSVWHIAIRLSISKATVEEYRKLIREIQTEGALAPVSMARLLGEEVYRIVLQCKY